MTGVTDNQIQGLGIEITPQHPEPERRRAGVIFESQTAFRDMLATHVVANDEQRFVTGENWNSGRETSPKILAIVQKNSAS